MLLAEVDVQYNIHSCIVVNGYDMHAIRQPGFDHGVNNSSSANQAVHPSAVDKLVSISRQWVTADEYCGPSAQSGI